MSDNASQTDETKRSCLFCEGEVHEYVYVEWGNMDENGRGEIPVCQNHHLKIAGWCS